MSSKTRGLRVSWKALFSIKSIIRFTEMIMALVALTLTGTFETETTILCRTLRNNKSYTIDYNADFPFDYLDCHYGADNLSQIEFDRDYGAMAQSFLAWGVITVIYCILAIFAYVMLSESQEWKHYDQTMNILYFADFGASILWSVLWLAVCIIWTIGAVQMEDFVEDHSVCFSNDTQLSRDDANFAQTYNAIAIGYLSVVFWTVSIGLMLKSTFIYQSIVNTMSRSKGGYEPIQ